MSVKRKSLDIRYLTSRATGGSVRLIDRVHVGKKKLRDSKVMTILSRNGNHKEFRKSRVVRIGDKHHH